MIGIYNCFFLIIYNFLFAFLFLIVIMLYIIYYNNFFYKQKVQTISSYQNSIKRSMKKLSLKFNFIYIKNGHSINNLILMLKLKNKNFKLSQLLN